MYLCDANDENKYFLVPVIPEAISYKEGDTSATSVTIINIGQVDFPDGNDLEEVGWSSFFPARYDPSYCSGPLDSTPFEWRDRLLAWKDARTAVRVIIARCDINKLFYIKTFDWELRGAEGDVYYTVTFREFIEPKPKKIPLGTTTINDPNNKTLDDRKPVKKPIKPSKYKVKKGDSIYSVAKRYGLQWKDVYAKNKATIGLDPSKLKPGQVLKL
jgi:LysM repeat protein